jgi:hypothetical protein
VVVGVGYELTELGNIFVERNLGGPAGKKYIYTACIVSLHLITFILYLVFDMQTWKHIWAPVREKMVLLMALGAIYM